MSPAIKTVIIYPVPFQISTAITVPKAYWELVSQGKARASSPMLRRVTFNKPSAGFKIEVNTMPTISVERTDGINITPRWKFKRRICLVNSSASNNPNTFLMMVVTKVKTSVFEMTLT